MACSVTIEEYSTIVVSENAVLFAGLNTFSRTKRWKRDQDAGTLYHC